MITKKIYLAGQFVEGNQKLEVSNPYDNKVFGQTWLADEDHIQQAILKAGEALEPCRKLSHYQRHEILMQIAHGIEARFEEFVSVLAQEAAKPYRYAVAEVKRAIQTIKVSAEEARRLPMEYMRLDWSPDAKGKEGLVKYFPAGIVAGISPFNFPLNLSVHKIAPAIAAGCPIILKPASSTPLTTLLLAEIIDQTELPKGGFSVLSCNRKAGNILVTHPDIAVLTFTGSPEVGWQMKNQAGKKKVVLELGGNAGTIVAASADLEHAVNRCLVGAFAYQGQVCIHAQRIYVHRSLFKEFTNALVEKTKNLKIGPPTEPSTEITAMIDQNNAVRVENWINEAIEQGAGLLCGGIREGALVYPTILTQTKAEMKVNCEEVFGPVVTIEAFDEFEKAVATVNNSRFGLQAGVFTNVISEMDLAFDQIHAGGVIINDVPTFRTDHMPYGGIKDSGLGREGVKYAILDYMEPKILVKNFY